MKPSDMLSRSKIKMQESIRHMKEDLPEFGNYDFSPNYGNIRYGNQREEKVTIQQNRVDSQYNADFAPRYNTYRTQFSQIAAIDNGFKKEKNNRNQVMRELRQEYEILKNLNIDDSIHIKKYSKPQGDSENSSNKEEQNSRESSEFQSKKVSKVRKAKSPGNDSREVHTLIIQKKQLQIVIGNSMKKIEELLNNEMTLKKTIYELKSQIEGKGGIHQEYEKVIKNYQKNQAELIAELDRLKHQGERFTNRTKEFNDKIRNLESQLAQKDREIRNNFDQQRKLHEALRNEKDKFLNLDIQLKGNKMELDLLEKQKNNQINRLVRQFQAKEGGSEKQMAYIIRKLQDQVKKLEHQISAKDIKFQQDFAQREKKYLQELSERDRQLSQIFSEKDRQYFQLINEKERQFKEESSDKYKTYSQEIAEKEKRFNYELAEREKRCNNLQTELENVRNESREYQAYSNKHMPIIEEKVKEKNILEELLFRSKEVNENNNKALTDSMNLIFAKMSELQKKSDESLKRQVETLKKKTEENRSNSNEKDLLARVIELEKMIDKEMFEKGRLTRDITDMNNHKAELQLKNQLLEKRIKDLNDKQENLRREIDQLDQIKSDYNITSNEVKFIREQLNVYIQKDKENILREKEREKQFIIFQNQTQKSFHQRQRQIAKTIEQEIEKQFIKRQKEFIERQKSRENAFSQRQNQFIQKEKDFIQKEKLYQEKHSEFSQKDKDYEQYRSQHRDFIENSSVEFKKKSLNYDEEIRNLRRKIDEAQFETEKVKKEGEFGISMNKATHDAEMNRLIADLNLWRERSKSAEEGLRAMRIQLEEKIANRQNQIAILKEAIEKLRILHIEELSKQKLTYEERISAIEGHSTSEIKLFNDKFLAISSSNEKLFGQLANHAALEKQIIELRRALRYTKSLNTSVDHLWGVKEAEYSNIHDILRSFDQ